MSLVEPLAGRIVEASVTGDGPIDAICKAIAKASSIPVNVLHSVLDSGTSGGDALSWVTLELQEGDRIYRGRAVSPDILEAVASACVEAINAIYQERLRSAAGEPAFDSREDDPLRDFYESQILPMTGQSPPPPRLKLGGLPSRPHAGPGWEQRYSPEEVVSSRQQPIT